MTKKILFRILSGLLCFVFLSFGVIVVYDRVNNMPLVWDSTFKVAIASFIWGIYLLIKFMRGK